MSEDRQTGTEEPRDEERGIEEHAEEGDQQSTTEVRMRIGDADESTIIAAGGDVVFQNISAGDLVGRLLQDLKETRQAREAAKPSPPPPSADVQEKVDHWFRHELDTDQERYFAVALSLFEGLKWTDLWDIYQAILEAKELDEAEEERKRSVFEQTDEDLLVRMRAELVPADDQTAEWVKFKDEAYPGAILAMMRRKYRALLIELLDGLRRLGEHPYWAIRSRAGAAVAEIAKLDFHRTRRQTLEPWARDERAYVRAVVGYTASALYRDDVCAGEIRKLLQEWGDPATQGLSWRYRWTAASAYKQVGLSHPDLALEDLQLVAHNGDIRIANAVIYALVVMSLEGHLSRVLSALKKWVEHKENVVCLTSVLAFFTLATGYIGIARERVGGELDEEAEDIDDLLTLLEEEPSIQSLVVSVMIRAFEYKLWRQAFQVFEGWVQQAGTDVQLQNTVRNMIAMFFVQLPSRGRERTLRVLKRWEQGKDDLLTEMGQSARLRIMDAASQPPSTAEPQAHTEPRIVFG
jgi:hypothetical protein